MVGILGILFVDKRQWLFGGSNTFIPHGCVVCEDMMCQSVFDENREHNDEIIQDDAEQSHETQRARRARSFHSKTDSLSLDGLEPSIVVVA
jgi:hypothetical protein